MASLASSVALTIQDGFRHLHLSARSAESSKPLSHGLQILPWRLWRFWRLGQSMPAFLGELDLPCFVHTAFNLCEAAVQAFSASHHAKIRVSLVDPLCGVPYATSVMREIPIPGGCGTQISSTSIECPVQHFCESLACWRMCHDHSVLARLPTDIQVVPSLLAGHEVTYFQTYNLVLDEC